VRVDVQISSTVTLIELLWALLGFIGIFPCLYNIRRSTRKLRAVKSRRLSYSQVDRDALCRIIVGRIRTAVLQIIKLIIVVGIGVLAMLQENPPDSIPWTVLRYVVTIGLLIIPFIISLQATLDALEERYLEQTLERE
jgi:RsiW-degrading membrane proteinase PrsW (M82 family)